MLDAGGGGPRGGKEGRAMTQDLRVSHGHGREASLDATAPVPPGDNLVQLCYGSRDVREGIMAFVARRCPVWEGR